MAYRALGCVFWVCLVACVPGSRTPGARGETALAFLGFTEGYWQVWLANEHGDGVRKLTTTPVDKVDISWFPSGTELLVNTQEGRLERVDARSGKQTPIPFPFQGIQDARLSPNGRLVAFSWTPSDSPDANEIWVCGLDGTAPRQLTNRARLQQRPSWDPSGQWIYYTSGLGPGDGFDIWRVSVAGTTDERLSFGGAYRIDVAVASDGTLAYSSDEGGWYDLSIKAPGASPVQITHDDARDSRPAYSADERAVYFESTRGGVLNLWRIPRGGGAAEPITSLAGYGARYPALAPARARR